jgi:hypothetical protein
MKRCNSGTRQAASWNGSRIILIQVYVLEVKMQKWEYMTPSLLPDEKNVPRWTDAPEDNRSASARLNELGEEGWELVSVAQHIESGDKRRTVYWPKRPVE